MSDRRSITVLVFDDDLVHHKAFLDGLPAEFVYRANADRAVDDVAEVQPDCVFMDFSMGTGVNGAQAVVALRAVYDHAALPILAISSDARCNRAMRMAGATEGVVKMALPERFFDFYEVLFGHR